MVQLRFSFVNLVRRNITVGLAWHDSSPPYTKWRAIGTPFANGDPLATPYPWQWFKRIPVVRPKTRDLVRGDFRAQAHPMPYRTPKAWSTGWDNQIPGVQVGMPMPYGVQVGIPTDFGFGWYGWCPGWDYQKPGTWYGWVYGIPWYDQIPAPVAWRP